MKYKYREKHQHVGAAWVCYTENDIFGESQWKAFETEAEAVEFCEQWGAK